MQIKYEININYDDYNGHEKSYEINNNYDEYR